MGNQLTQLAFAYRVGAEQKLPVGIDKFVEACVIENKTELIKAVEVLDFTPEYIVDSFVCALIKSLFIEKNSEQLLNIIGGGSIFKIYSKLLNSFLDDEDIKQAIVKDHEWY